MAQMFPIRTPCPIHACICEHATVCQDPSADKRILALTKNEEKRLIDRIHAVENLADLERVLEKISTQLGISVEIFPGLGEVRTAKGLDIYLSEKKGLCKITQAAIPAAIRKAMQNKPEMIIAILDRYSLWGS